MSWVKLKLPPTINASQMTTRTGRFYKTANYKEYKATAFYDLPLKMRNKPIKKPNMVRLDVVFEISRDCDIDSRVKVLLDSMEKHLFENDSQIVELYLKKVKVKKGEECCHVKISKTAMYKL